MKAVKGNREYSNISDAQKSYYQNAGFDIYDDDGQQVSRGRGKTVAYEEHMRVVGEIEKLQQLAAERHAENEALKAENEALKAENEALKAENEALKAENEALKASSTGQKAETKSNKKPAEKKEGE